MDGFSAPVSAGAFVDAAASGRYTNQKINAASPNLFIGDGSGPTVPLEVRVGDSGDAVARAK